MTTTPTFDISKIKDVHVELTDKCNAECPCCVRRISGGKLRPIIQNIEIGLDYFKLLDEELLKNVEYWMLCGVKGDPIACTELFEICEFLLEKNPNTYISVRTNGGFRNVEWWKKLGNLFVGTECEVMFGIDGLEDTNHLYRKNVKWNKLWDNLMAYNSTGAKTCWQFLPFEHNEHQQEEIEKICKQYNILLFVQEPFGFGPLEDNKIQPINVYNRDGEYIYNIWPAKLKERGILKGELDPAYGIPEPGEIDQSQHWINNKKGDFDIKCDIVYGPTADLYIDSSGALFPCCFIGASIGYDDDKQIQNLFKNLDEFVPSETNTVKNILSNKFFTDTLPKGITGDLDTKPVYLGKCIEQCGNCYNILR